MSILNDTAEILLAYVIEHEFTTEQVANSTMPQVKSILGDDTPEQFTRTHFNKVRKIVWEAVKKNERAATKNAIRDQLITWLNANGYDEPEFDYFHENGKLCVQIWPNGKPEGAE